MKIRQGDTPFLNHFYEECMKNSTNSDGKQTVKPFCLATKFWRGGKTASGLP